MYNDYPTIYESTLNFNYIYIGIAIAVLFIIIIFTFISLAKIFKKANRSGIYAWIPFYNLWILLEITNKPKWYFILMLFPIVNLIFYINIIFSLAKTFRKSKLFSLGMIILPFIFLPILAFSSNEYFGINLIAMEGKNTITNIPAMETKREEPKIEEHIEKDQSLKNINISIGGGVYQKNYTNDLLQVDEKQAILKETEEQLQNIQAEEKAIIHQNNTFINSNINEENIIENKTIENKSVTELEIPSIIPNVVTNMHNEVKPATFENITSPTTSLPNSTIPNNQDEFIFCPKCGTKLKNGATKCFLCGQNLS